MPTKVDRSLRIPRSDLDFTVPKGRESRSEIWVCESPSKYMRVMI